MTWPCTWWELTGRKKATLTGECPDGHRTERDLGVVDRDVDWSDRCQWPEQCETCGHVFDYGYDADRRSMTSKYEYRQPATGELTFKLPPGALYDYPAYHDYRTGSDGRSLMCVLPNKHHWFIDSRANNCGLPDDETHRCWCRHGDPMRPETMHVDKSCETCVAGAGSIQSGDFHGFLHDGAVTVT